MPLNLGGVILSDKKKVKAVSKSWIPETPLQKDVMLRMKPEVQVYPISKEHVPVVFDDKIVVKAHLHKDTISLPPSASKQIGTGLHIMIPIGYQIQIESASPCFQAHNNSKVEKNGWINLGILIYNNSAGLIVLEDLQAIALVSFKARNLPEINIIES